MRLLIPRLVWRESSSKREARRSLQTGLVALSATALAIALLPEISTASENKGNTMTYPPTERTDTVDTHFGTTVADPYRWLEGDIRRDGKVEAWITKQKNLTEDYLATLPGRDLFKQRLQALFDHERLPIPPEKRGDRYFFVRSAGLEAQPVLYVRENGTDRVVVDPNSWSEDGATALAEWAVSHNGRYLAYAIQEGGADWRTIRVMDIDTGRILDDEIRWARFMKIGWVQDDSGFFYSRNAEPEEGAAFEAQVLEHTVNFHRLETPQSQDRLIYASDTDQPLIHMALTTADGRYVVIHSSRLGGGNGITVIDLAEDGWTPETLVSSLDHAWTLIGNVGARLFFTTEEGAERGKVVAINFDAEKPVFQDFLPHREDAVILGSNIVGDRLVVSYMVDAKTQVERFKLDGTRDGVVELPSTGTAGAFRGRPGDNESFYVFSSQDTPTTIYRYDVATNTSTVWAKPRIASDLDQLVVEQHFFASKDGTRIPMFVMRRKDVTGPAPTMLYGYGGFGIPLIPYFSAEALAWVEQGGVYAMPNIRGGGEYGRAWHEAGRLANKQNSFDDFIAAAEFLKREGITPPDGLAIHGGSNGGLLVGAVVNQRPDLFAAALPDVAVLDMLRFPLFTGGTFWTQEYGDPAVQADFKNLLSYSPLHNVRDGTDYPAILTTTGDTDDRVVPAHSFKYVAALQAAALGNRPRLLRVETRAGHGAGKPTDKIIEQTADMWAFAAHWSGLRLQTATTPDGGG